jgi:hypothetical protein
MKLKFFETADYELTNSVELSTTQEPTIYAATQ